MAKVSNETLGVKLDGLIEQVAEIAHRQQEQITRHEEAIYGNGKAGLITEVSRLRDGYNGFLWTLRAFGAATVAALVGLWFK